MCSGKIKRFSIGQVWWLKPVILSSQPITGYRDACLTSHLCKGAQIKGSQSRLWSGIKQDHISKTTNAKKTREVPSKGETLSSNPSTTKKNVWGAGCWEKTTGKKGRRRKVGGLASRRTSGSDDDGIRSDEIHLVLSIFVGRAEGFCVSHLCHHDKIPETNNLSEERFILAHGVRDFSSNGWLAHYFEACSEAEHHGEGQGGGKLLTSWWPGSSDQGP
jgi:hypothetical protein